MLKYRNGYYGELWASLMHRELEQWVDHLTNPTSDCSLNSDDTIPPTDEDWVHMKPVPSNISNLQQVIPDWVQPERSQMTGLPMEQEGIADDLQSDSSLTTTDVDRGVEETEEGSGFSSEPGQREEETSRSVSSAAQPAGLSWTALEGLKKRFNFDILPKVCF